MLLHNGAMVAFLATCTRMHYGRRADTLYLFRDRLESGPVIALGGNYACRLSWDRTRILAIEVRNFRRIVLKENAELATLWRVYHAPWRRILRRLFV